MRHLTIGVIVEDPNALTSPQTRLIAALARDPRFHVAAVVRRARPLTPGRTAIETYLAIEESLFARRRHPSDADKEVARSACNLAEDAEFPAIDVAIDMSGYGAYAGPLAAARFGVWRPSAFDGAAGFRDSLDDADTTALLVTVATHDGESVVAVGALNTKFVASRNRAFLREKSVALLIHALARLHRDGRVEPHPDPMSVAKASLFDLPRYWLGLGAHLGARFIKLIAARIGIRPRMWSIKIGVGDALDFEPDAGVEIEPPQGSFRADPFLFVRDGRRFVFFEDYAYRTRKGEISVAEIADGKLRPLGSALVSDHHLSFPFVFDHDGQAFMMPESHQKECVEVWRCEELPLRWRLHSTALKGRSAADSVMFEDAGAWWLFTNIADDPFKDHCSELHVFKIDGPDLKSVVPHALNPVVIDSRTARNAGRVFRKDDRLFRLSQENAGGVYGRGLNVMEITRLDLHAYEERIARRIGPEFDDALVGLHHFDAVDGVCVYDIRKR